MQGDHQADYRGRFIPSLSSHSMWVTCLHPLCFHTLRRQCCLILFNLGQILGNVPQAAHNRLLGLWPSVLTALVHLSQLRRRLQRSLFQLLTHIFFSVCGQGFSRATPLCCYCCPRDILQEFLERVSGFFTSLNFATFCLTFRLFKQSFFLRVGISQGICLTLVYAERSEGDWEATALSGSRDKLHQII